VAVRAQALAFKIVVVPRIYEESDAAPFAFCRGRCTGSATDAATALKSCGCARAAVVTRIPVTHVPSRLVCAAMSSSAACRSPFSRA
jgi:hypothetical protein